MPDDPIAVCAREIVDHVYWKAPEQIVGCVAESLWDMVRALGVDEKPLRPAMQQITREVHAKAADFIDAAVVERRLRAALSEAA